MQLPFLSFVFLLLGKIFMQTLASEISLIFPAFRFTVYDAACSEQSAAGVCNYSHAQ